jgi:threonine synthase
VTGDHLVCTACRSEAEIGDLPSTCPHCDGILDFIPGRPPEAVRQLEAEAGIWQWADGLPRCAPRNRISLGEGPSPLLKCSRLGAEIGAAELWVKNDGVMPTGSFKDRGLALTVSLAREYGRPGMILSSSGNAGASAAAYAARAGIPATVLVPQTTPRGKLAQIVATGAQLVLVNGDTSDCCRMARTAAASLGRVNASTTFYNPYAVEAYSTVAFELASLRPEVIVLPISCGPLLVGIMKGFALLAGLGVINHVPRPVAAQPAACAPIVRGFERRERVRPWAREETVASALNDTLNDYERDGDYTIGWLRRFCGTAVATTDDEIVAAAKALGRLEGIFAEPSAAVPIAACRRLIEGRWLSGKERIVAVATGHGLKDPSIGLAVDLPPPIEANTDAIVGFLGERASITI